MPVAQMNEAMRNIKEVSLVAVFASPATIGIKAFTDGVSLPKKIYHIPFRVKVLCRAEWIFVKVFSSNIKSFCASGRSYFFISKNVMMLPIVLPSAPAIIVGIKSKLPVLTKYPAMM